MTRILPQEKIRECPYCDCMCEADFVDIGVGEQQCGPFHCDNCGSSQIGPYDKKRELNDDEKRTGWYKPGGMPGSSANVVHGNIVSAEVMKAEYQREFKNNPLWYDKEYVKRWYEKMRRKSDEQDKLRL